MGPLETLRERTRKIESPGLTKEETAESQVPDLPKRPLAAAPGRARSRAEGQAALPWGAQGTEACQGPLDQGPSLSGRVCNSVWAVFGQFSTAP